jgi:DNA-binding MarR family transcriptional regulator
VASASAGTRRPKDHRDPRWLSKDQEAAWRVLLALTVQLPWALECQLQRDAQLSVVEYHALAMLSDQPDHTLRMSDLAVLTHASLSRLSHLIKRLETRGLVRREPDPEDGRYTLAILTPSGHQHLKRSAPGHVANVRELVIDTVSPEELHLFHDIAERILNRINPSC